MPIDINALISYCNKYSIPEDHFLEILEDYKVLPMLRGKGFEYYVVDRLSALLDPEVWVVTKYNTNPQQNTTDSDLVVRHVEENIEIVIETKTASRGSFKTGARARKCRVPHYTVKCHKSRSNTTRTVTNDKYFVDEFDIVISNPANAFIASGEFELMDNDDARSYLLNRYGTYSADEVLPVLSSEIVFALTSDLAMPDSTIPRTPIVQFEDDPNWHGYETIAEALNVVVNRKIAAATRRPTRPAHLPFRNN